jgi:hypothetical protein
MQNIKDYDDLHPSLRRAGHYSYLNTHHNAYWLDAVDLAHKLMTAHAESNPDRVYFQDQFSNDFSAALVSSDVDPAARLVGQYQVDSTLSQRAKKDDPNWVEFSIAMAALADSGRGNALIVKMIYGEDSHWKARVNLGGGHIGECGTLPRNSQKPTYLAVVANMIIYEGYLARRQADKERLILANYARITDFDLQPGAKLQGIEVSIEGKLRTMHFTIREIHLNGSLSLSEGRFRGESTSFNTTIETASVTALNIARRSSPLAQARDLFTLGLF